MCKCLSTSDELLEMLNSQREKKGHDPVPYTWMMSRCRKSLTFLRPVRVIGRSFVWDRSTVKKIVKLLSGVPYRKNTFRWKKYLAEVA